MPDTPAGHDVLTAQIERLENENRTLVQQLIGLERDISERFDEISTLTALYLKTEKEATDLRSRNTALHNRTKTLYRDLAKTRLEEYRETIQKSEFFDENWYLNEYEDVSKSGVDPLEHFILEGAQEYRNPSDKFNTYWYVSQHKDVQQSSANPLIHYIRNGIKERRSPLPPSPDNTKTPEPNKEAEQ